MKRRVTLEEYTHTHTGSLINKKINNIKIKDSKTLISKTDIG